MKKVLAFAIFMLSVDSAIAEVVGRCEIGPGPTLRVEVIREQKIADSWVYSLKQNGTIRPFFGDKQASRGTSVRIACVGKKTRALVVSGEFSANALQGFVLTYTPGRRTPGRFNFAEKRRPGWLFLNQKEAILLVPTGGLGETNKRYVVYRNATGVHGEPSAEGSDLLPRETGYEKIDLNNADK